MQSACSLFGTEQAGGRTDSDALEGCFALVKLTHAVISLSFPLLTLSYRFHSASTKAQRSTDKRSKKIPRSKALKSPPL